MRLPRNETGRRLLKKLEKYGYKQTRRSGSHIRMTRYQEGEETHHITVPDHAPLRVGTLASILRDIADHLGKSKESHQRILFLMQPHASSQYHLH
jgi:predicted RNA binding protein YcfA (HicA-like mRNA interferase family)